MKKNIIYLILITTAVIFLTGCGEKNNQNESGTDTTLADNIFLQDPAVDSLFSIGKDYTFKEKYLYKAKLKSRINAFSNEIERLRYKFNTSSSIDKEGYNAIIKDMEMKRDTLKSRLNKIELVEEEKWDDYKAGIDSMLKNEKSSYKKWKVKISPQNK